MAKYILTVNSENPFKNAWNDEEKDFWVAHETQLDTPWSISDADFEKVIRSQVEQPTIVGGALVIGPDLTLAADCKGTLAEIQQGLSDFIFDLEHHINNNAENPSNLSQDLTDAKTLQTAVDNGTAGLSFDGEGNTAGFSWVDALYRAGNTVPAYTFV